MHLKPIQMVETFAQTRGLDEINIDKNAIGIEIELEGKHILPINDLGFKKYWVPTEDNSLRKLAPGDQTVEYRFETPLSLKDTEQALDQLQHHLTRPSVKIYDSGRTSVHVHVNCYSETMATIYNFITLAIIFDELLVSQNGFHRIGNNFCLRAKDAEGMLVQLTNSMHHYGDLRGVELNYRYSSINVMSLFKFGTVEFRSMECTVDKARLLNWVKTLVALKHAARRFANPLEIIGQFSLYGPERFFLNTLGSQAGRYMHVSDRHKMLFDGLRLVQEFANSTTWEPMKPGERKPVRGLRRSLHNQIIVPALQEAPMGVPGGAIPVNWDFNGQAEEVDPEQ